MASGDALWLCFDQQAKLMLSEMAAFMLKGIPKGQSSCGKSIAPLVYRRPEQWFRACICPDTICTLGLICPWSSGNDGQEAFAARKSRLVGIGDMAKAISSLRGGMNNILAQIWPLHVRIAFIDHQCLCTSLKALPRKQPLWSLPSMLRKTFSCLL